MLKVFPCKNCIIISHYSTKMWYFPIITSFVVLCRYLPDKYLQIMTSLVTQETKISSALLDETDNKNTSEQNGPKSLPRHQTPPSSQKKLRSFKIIVLGESGVGKTCLSFRFCAGRFPLHSEATIGLDFREKVRRKLLCIIPNLQ